MPDTGYALRPPGACESSCRDLFRLRRPESLPCAYAFSVPEALRLVGRDGEAIGSTTRKQLPSPTVLSAVTAPPIAATRSRTIARPSPNPPVVRTREASVR